jgi:hypothetical protein
VLKAQLVPLVLKDLKVSRAFRASKVLLDQLEQLEISVQLVLLD